MDFVNSILTREEDLSDDVKHELQQTVKTALVCASYTLNVYSFKECIFIANEIDSQLGIFVKLLLFRLPIMKYDFLRLEIHGRNYFLIDGKIQQFGGSYTKYEFYKYLDGTDKWEAKEILKSKQHYIGFNIIPFDDELHYWFTRDIIKHIARPFIYCYHCFTELDKTDIKNPKWVKLDTTFGTRITCPKCGESLYMYEYNLEETSIVANDFDYASEIKEGLKYSIYKDCKPVKLNLQKRQFPIVTDNIVKSTNILDYIKDPKVSDDEYVQIKVKTLRDLCKIQFDLNELIDSLNEEIKK